MEQRTLAALLSALAALLPGVAAAQGAGTQETPISLATEVRECQPPLLAPQQIHDALSLELRLSGIVRAAAGERAEGLLTIEMGCGATTSARFELSRPGSRGSAEEAIVLGDVQRADLARAVALSAAEFVRARWKQLTLEAAPAAAEALHEEGTAAAAPPAPAAPAAQPSPVAAAAPAPPQADSGPTQAGGDSLDLNLLVAARYYAEYATLGLGASGGVARGPFSADIEVVGSRYAVDWGEATFATANVTAAAQLWRLQREAARFGVGPAASFGVSWASAAPADSSISAASDLALYADLRLRAEAGFGRGGTTLRVRADGGLSAGTAQYAGEALIGAHAGWFGALAVGAGF